MQLQRSGIFEFIFISVAVPCSSKKRSWQEMICMRNFKNLCQIGLQDSIVVLIYDVIILRTIIVNRIKIE